MTAISKKNLLTTIIDTVKNFRCTPVCGKEERAEYRRKKALRKKAFSVAAVVMIVTLLTCGMIFAFAKENSAQDSAYRTVVVEDGDTLWSIAKDCFPDSDPRDGIEKIRNFNSMDNYTIYAGMTLLVPAY